MYDFSKCFCGCEYTCKWVTCVFNNRCIKGKFIEMCGDFLVLRDNNGKCYYVNPERILYMIADCPKPSCNSCC